MRNKKPGFLRNPGEKTGITASSRYALAGIQVVWRRFRGRLSRSRAPDGMRRSRPARNVSGRRRG